MLSTELKTQIQGAYTRFLEAKGLKPRYGQRLMIAEVAKMLGAIKADDEGRRDGEPAIVAVEAGTGTGKTVAYSLAAIPAAKAAGKRLVIATATVALQEQIVHKDLPDLMRNSGLDFSFHWPRAAVAIYACRDSTRCCRKARRRVPLLSCSRMRASISMWTSAARSSTAA